MAAATAMASRLSERCPLTALSLAPALLFPALSCILSPWRSPPISFPSSLVPICVALAHTPSPCPLHHAPYIPLLCNCQQHKQVLQTFLALHTLLSMMMRAARAHASPRRSRGPVFSAVPTPRAALLVVEQFVLLLAPVTNSYIIIRTTMFRASYCGCIAHTAASCCNSHALLLSFELDAWAGRRARRRGAARGGARGDARENALCVCKAPQLAQSDA